MFTTICQLALPQGWTKFQTDGSGKSSGLKLSIKYPSDWIQKDGTRPHILSIMESEIEGGLIQMVVYINVYQRNPLAEEISVMYSKENIKKTTGAIEIIEFDKTAQIDNERCCVALVKVEQKVYQDLIRSISKVNIIIWDKYLVQIGFMIFSNDNRYETQLKIYNKHRDTFNEIMSNVAILSKWE